MKAPPSSRIMRAGKMAWGAARLGLASRTQQHATASETLAQQAQMGRLLFQTLNQLKGTALKLSQLLSLETELLPEAMRNELAKACHQGTPLNRALVHKVVRQALGAAPQTVFASFDDQAFAAASLGQVHNARLKAEHSCINPHTGVAFEAVAVKLQYPGIAACVDSDLSLLRSLLLNLAAHTDWLPERRAVDNTLSHIESTLREELDYHHEAQMQAWFAQALSTESHLHWVIPALVPALCHQTILTSEKLQGLHLSDWLQQQPDQATRDYFGQQLWDGFWHCVFRLRRIQADPHAGNFLFLAPTSGHPAGRLGCLDFGCTVELPGAFIKALRISLSALQMQHSPLPTQAHQFHQAYAAMGMIDTDLPEPIFAAEVMPALQNLHAWQRQVWGQAVFDFSRHTSYPAQNKQSLAAMQHLRSPHAALPFFDRAYLGLVHLLKQLQARVRTSAVDINGA